MDERAVLAPSAEVSFVHVNEHARLRLYDRCPEGPAVEHKSGSSVK